MSGDFNEVVASEGVSDAEQEAGKEVFSDVAEGESNYYTDEARSSQNSKSQPCESRHLKNKVDADKKYWDGESSHHYREQKWRGNTAREEVMRKQRHQLGEKPRDGYYAD